MQIAKDRDVYNAEEGPAGRRRGAKMRKMQDIDDCAAHALHC